MRSFSRPEAAYDRRIDGLSHGDLLLLAAQGERSAWDALVDRFNDMVWSVARSFRLDDATAKDVSQTVWMKLVENLDRIKDPERLPGWLATTCRREALRTLKQQGRQVPTEFEYDVADDTAPSLDEMLIDDEETRVVTTAFRELDGDCQELLRLMTVEPSLSYEEIADITGRPIGALGPTRARCLDKLKSVISRISGRSGSS